jgi:hypothetical protein
MAAFTPSNYLGDIKSIPSAAWVDTLEQVVSSKSDLNRPIVCINKKGVIQHFNNKADAKKAGFRQLSIRKIVTLSAAILSKSEDPNVTYRAARVLKELVARKKIKIEKKSTHLFSFKLKKTMEAIESAEKMSVAYGGSKAASPSRLEELKVSLEDQDRQVTRSVGGRDGVFFLQSSHARPVLKLLVTDGPLVRFSERLLEKAGFKTANSYFLMIQNNSSPEEQALCQGVKGVVNELKLRLEQKAGTQENRGVIDNIRLQVLAGKEIQVANKIEATSLSQLNATEFEEALRNDAFLKEMGRMVIFDAFMGNDDRIQPWGMGKKINLGNMMVAETIPGKYDLYLIDNSSKLTSDKGMISRIGLEALLEGKHEAGIEVYAETIVKEASSKYGDEVQLDKEQIMKNLQEGVQEGAQQILRMFPTQLEVRVLLEMSETQHALDLNTIVQHLNYMRKVLK